MRDGWEVKRLVDVCALITCGVAARPQYVDDGVPFLSAKNVKEGQIIWSGYNCISEPTHKELIKNNKPLLGDILYTRVGSYGEAAVVENDCEFSVFVSLTLIKVDNGILNNYFLKYYLNSDYVKKIAKKSISSSGVGNLNVGTVRKFPILIPPLSEQQRIVAILDKAFAAIDKAKANAEQNLKNAKELFDSSLSQAVIGKITKKWREDKAPEKVNGALEMKQLLLKIKGVKRKSGRSETTVGHETITSFLPKEWGVVNVEALFNLIDYRGKNPPRSNIGFRLITAKNIKMSYISDKPITFISEDTYKKWMIRGFPKLGDIFFVTEGHTMGYVALNNREDDFALAQRIITLQPAVPFDTKFFFYFMLSSYFQRIVKLNATGAAAVGMKGSKLRNLPLSYPSIAEQKFIVQKLDVLSAETKKLEKLYQQKIDDLDELKKSILQKAFAGELNTEKELAV